MISVNLSRVSENQVGLTTLFYGATLAPIIMSFDVTVFLRCRCQRIHFALQNYE